MSKTWQHLQEDTGRIAAIEDLSRDPDWRLQANNEPAVITCSDVMAERRPELVVTFLKSMVKVGRRANEHERAAAVILDRQTCYRDAEDTCQCIKHIDMFAAYTGRIWTFDHGECQYGDGWASIVRDDLHCTCQAMGYDSDTSADSMPQPMAVGSQLRLSRRPGLALNNSPSPPVR